MTNRVRSWIQWVVMGGFALGAVAQDMPIRENILQVESDHFVVLYQESLAARAPELVREFPLFVAGMLKGPENFPDVLKTVYDSNREEFTAHSGVWVAERFGGPE